MIKLSNVRIPINYNEETLRQEAARKLHTRESVISRAELFRLSSATGTRKSTVPTSIPSPP